VGNGVTLVAGYITPLNKKDTISPPSVFGGVAVLTDNGTRAWAAATELYFDQDRYHVVSGFAHGDLNYDFYGTGTDAGNAGVRFGLNQKGDILFVEASRRVFWDIFIGPRLWFGRSRLVAQHAGETHSELPPLDVDSDMRSLGFKIERDTTENRFYPTQGTMLKFGSDFFSKEIGSSYTFQRYRLTFNSFHSLDKNQVFAYNFFACSTGGDSPFYGECIFGMQNELRGYPSGRYIDRKMLATQGEYRLALPWRFGVVAFGGLGEVAPNISSFRADDILPSGGVGPRFSLSTKYHLNLRADFAWGKNGHTFSMGMGEAF
jgi:outer membrane protein assembly factor BamA